MSFIPVNVIKSQLGCFKFKFDFNTILSYNSVFVRSLVMKSIPFYSTHHFVMCPLFFRTSELVALIAISTTFFLFLHTRDLNTKLKEMEVKLQPEDLLSSNQLVSGKIKQHHMLCQD